ncbi:hypothetical protein vseg_016369 [Gypsophila vaccaria]
MSLNRKLEGEIEIREGAREMFHEIYKSKPHHVCHAAPHFAESCDLLEGQFGQPGSILLWKYKLGGDKKLTMKTKIEEIDEENKLVRQSVIEGDILENYKTIIGTCQVIPKNSETCMVRWTLDYVKLTPQTPEPSILLDYLLSAAKDIDDHHHGVKK